MSSKNHGEHFDYNVRQWCIDSSIEKNKKGCKTSLIIDDAKTFYGFLFPENGQLKEVKDVKRNP